MTLINRFADPKDPTNKDKFVYKHPDGTVIKDKKILEYIAGLRIPPMWNSVQIFYNMSGRQTCCGYDARARLQCLYNPAHIAKARANKLCDLIEFGNMLPKITAAIHLKDLKITKQNIISSIIQVIIASGFRLGTLTYEAQNASYGITTIRRQHLHFKAGECKIAFIGKKGVPNSCVLRDATLIKFLHILYMVKKRDDHIFMYDGIHILHTDVNNYLNHLVRIFRVKTLGSSRQTRYSSQI
jgi:DNA topoisomerase-1